MSHQHSKQNPNNLPRSAPTQWSPEERKLWLIAKGAPANMMLFTTTEFAVISRQLQGEHNARAVLEGIVTRSANALGEYWKTEPDLENACDAARFDAVKYEEAARKAEHDLANAIMILYGASPAPCSALAEVCAGFETLLKEVREIIGRRRERIKKTQPEAGT